MGIPADQIMALTQRCAQAEVDRDKARARVAELEREHGSRTDAADPNGTTCARLKWWKDRDDAREDRVAELEAILRRVDVYFQHTGKVGDLPVSVHALLPKLIHRHEDGTETIVTPLPMWQP